LWVLSVALAGCSASYNGERLYWHAQQLEREITKDPGMATAAQYAQAIAAFERVVNEVPSTSWAAQAQFMVGSLYALKKDYEKARAAYALVLQNYNRFQQMALNARLAVARTYEEQEDWEASVAAYRDIAEYHPFSQPGTQAPLRIGAVLERHGTPEQAADAYASAVRAYQKLIAESPSLELTIQLKGFLIAAHQKLEQWGQAVELLEEVAALPEGINRPLVLLTLASIYDNKLDDAVRARQAYERMVTEFPSHPLAKAAQTQLDRILKAASPPVAVAPEAAAPMMTTTP
jgi:tetratricopeptide (TPR) repeat protein